MLKDLKNRINIFFKENRKARFLLNKAKEFTLPGFDGIPVFVVVKFIFKELRKDLIPTRARSIAYSFFVAFFPAIIFLLTLLPYIPLEGFEKEFIALINDIVPDKVVNNFILGTMDDLINKPRGGLLSLGAFLAFYFSTQGVVSIIMSFNKTYSIYNRRNFIAIRWVALKLTFILLFLFLTSVSLLIVGQNLLDAIMQTLNIRSFWVNVAFNFLRYSTIIILFFVSFSTIYYYGPATKKKWKFITPGSTLATIISIISSLIFSNYISGFDRYNTIYGIFGSIILFLGCVYVNAFVLLIGFELNAAIYYKSIYQDDDELIA
ncbi:MAG: YihY/virulence factor BrkB family protein [Bacteroidetes bacterium]|nr:YihY/virulence factor BrkB family protein [Bacteroidota bacterium]